MGTIQNRLNGLHPYILGIRYIQDIIFVDAIFKDNWVIKTNDTIKQVLSDDNKNHYIFYSEDKNIAIDNILDLIEGIIKYNIERELKHKFLILKVDELKQIFKDNSLDTLKRLTFTLNEDILIPNDLPKEELPIDTPIAEETKISESIVEDIPTIKQRESKPNNFKGKVELPPKNKIELEFHESSKELTEGTCKCGPDEFCPKCMDEKSL